MSLAAGTKLGPYEILALIGKGGMGEVYRAHDARLGRDVAVKVSASQFSERFEREARAVAALNHPNICTLYDVGPNYLVMELVEGPTLAERIKEGPVPLAEALTLGHQIADALEEAHEKGVVHRDLKPGNIKVRPDGAVKVLDFGLAKLGGTPTSRSDDSPTISMAATQAGVILGTAAYMAPEQARGKPVDKRADIWAFGVVLYEMLAGRPLFKGQDLSETLASVIKEEPEWKPVPVEVRRMLGACLEKDPKNRLRDISDVWRLLDDSAAATSAAPQAKNRGRWIWACSAAVLLIAAVSLAAVMRRAVPEQSMLRLEVTPPEGISFGQFDYSPVALAPDGRRLVFFAAGKDGKPALWMRSLDTNAASPLPGSEGAAGQPFWSPDSRWVAFAANGKLQKINIAGGQPEVICDAVGPVSNALGTWGSQGVIVFMQIGKPLQRVSETGGTPVAVFPFDAARDEWAERDPYFLPDGRHFLYHSSARESGIVLASLDGNPRRFLFPNSESAATYAPNPSGGGWMLYIVQDQLFARPFQPGKNEFTGEAAPVADHLISGPGWSASATGLLAFATSRPFRTQLRWLSRDGKPLGVLGDPGILAYPRISPDDQTVAFARVENQNIDIWLFDVARGTPLRFTFEPGSDSLPVWSSDSSHILYSSRRGNDILVVERPVNGVGTEQTLYKRTAAAASAFPTSLTRDGRWVILTEGVGNNRIALLSRSDGKFVPFLESQSEYEGLISPDGQWLLYSSVPAGRTEVFVRALPKEAGGPGGSGQWQISNAGGSQAIWRADGKEIFYVAPDGKMMAAPIESGGNLFRPGTPKPLFQTSLVNLDDLRNYDVSRDGQRFLLNQPVGSADTPISVIVNWPRLLKR